MCCCHDSISLSSLFHFSLSLSLLSSCFRASLMPSALCRYFRARELEQSVRSAVAFDVRSPLHGLVFISQQ